MNLTVIKIQLKMNARTHKFWIFRALPTVFFFLLAAVPVFALSPAADTPAVTAGDQLLEGVANKTLLIWILGGTLSLLFMAFIAIIMVFRSVVSGINPEDLKKKKKGIAVSKVATVALVLFTALPAAAQDVSETTSEAVAESASLIQGFNNDDLVIFLLGSAILFFFFGLILVVSTFMAILKRLMPQAEVSEEAIAEKSGLRAWFWNTFNAAAPVSKEKDMLLDHDYDGIRELDNDLPPWWKYGFYMTIFFAVVYMFYYHGGDSYASVSVEEYRADMAKAEKEKAAYLAKVASLINESNVEADRSESAVKAGSAIFDTNCKTCHGADGGGIAGPNLTDKYWVHGGDIKDIFKTVKYGVPAKGMIAWQSKLSPLQIQQVSSYILTLQGTTPQNPKKPEGELYEPESTDSGADDKDGEAVTDTEEAPEGGNENTEEGE